MYSRVLNKYESWTNEQFYFLILNGVKSNNSKLSIFTKQMQGNCLSSACNPTETGFVVSTTLLRHSLAVSTPLQRSQSGKALVPTLLKRWFWKLKYTLPEVKQSFAWNGISIIWILHYSEWIIPLWAVEESVQGGKFRYRFEIIRSIHSL